MAKRVSTLQSVPPLPGRIGKNIPVVRRKFMKVWRLLLLKVKFHPSRRRWFWLAKLSLLLAACSQVSDTPEPTGEAGRAVSSTGERYADFDIITVLPRDAIQAIDAPEFLSAQEAEDQYKEDELILGVEFNGDARAYSVPLLSSHEIVNDTVGGVKIAVTW